MIKRPEFFPLLIPTEPDSIQFLQIYRPEDGFDNLDKDRRDGKLKAELSKLGLEPTKDAYKEEDRIFTGC